MTKKALTNRNTIGKEQQGAIGERNEREMQKGRAGSFARN